MTPQGKKARQRDERRRAAAARARRRKIIIWSSVVGVAVVIGVVIGVVIAVTPLPDELSGVETFPQMSRDHLAQGEAPPDYNSSPATSGDHSPAPAECGIHTAEVPDEVQVHNLEHGAVVIQYQPDLDQTEIQALEEYARTKSSHILLAPRADLDDPVVVTSWIRMLRLPAADIDTIDVYYDQFVFSGPEVGVACPFAVDQSA